MKLRFKEFFFKINDYFELYFYYMFDDNIFYLCVEEKIENNVRENEYDFDIFVVFYIGCFLIK